MRLLTLGEASKLTGKSKPTISKAVRDGRLSGRKNEQGVFEIEASELFRVYPAKSSTPDSTPTAKSDTEHDAVAAMKVQHLEEKVAELEQRLSEMKDERDQAASDARQDRARFMALLEDQRPKSLWQRIRGK
jgi:hypothetical protein